MATSISAVVPADALAASLQGIARVLKSSLTGITSDLKSLALASRNVAAPAISALARSLAALAESGLKPLTQKLGDSFRQMAQKVSANWLGPIEDAVREPITRAVAAVGKRLAPLADGVSKVFAKTTGAVATFFEPLTGLMRSSFAKAMKPEEWLKPVTAKLGNAFFAWAARAEPWLKPLTSALGNQVSRLFNVEDTLKPATRGVASFAKSLGALVAGAGVAAGAAAGLGSVLAGFVAKAAPAALIPFTQALDDLQAVVGRALLPVFQIVTKVVRMAADTFITFGDSVGKSIGKVLEPFVKVLGVFFDVVGRVGQAVAKVLEPFAAAFGAVGDAFVTVLKAVQPVVNLLVDVLGGVLGGAMKVLAGIIETVVPYIELFAEGLGSLVELLTGWIRDLLEFLGVVGEEKEGTKPGASVGAAVRKADIGDLQGFANRAYVNALGGAAGDIPKESLDRLKDINKGIQSLPDRLAARLRDRIDPFSGGSDGRGGTTGAVARVGVGAAAGAAIGSFVPGVGTVVGGAVGGTVAAMRELFS